MLSTFFANGGQELQINAISSETLRAAQKNPNEYRGLVVRVAGFSAYWVEMSKPLQDQVIWRTEHCL